ncbi:MAG: CusA/CzcA family heavy metal efflux RND transporter [Planctomycetales bacterium]|nr:CusA/CzcA family heavy metal efflux RND transporter [Planctomycetales bacterium]
MLERILAFSIKNRVLVVLLTVAAALLGVASLQRLPIDAVPDITNNQVAINTVVPALSPVEVEKQVTFPIETSLAGIPGLEYTRSLSRNGFSQVTAVFEDAVDIYFARQQVNERLAEAKGGLPPGAEPVMGPISTGLGEVFMWTLSFERPASAPGLASDGRPGWQLDGSYLTPEGERLGTEIERLAYLRTVQDWIVRPQLRIVTGLAGVEAIGGYTKQYHVEPDPGRLISYGLTFGELIEALERNNASTGAGYVEHKGESYTVRATGRIESASQIGEVVIGERGGTPIRVRDVARVHVGGELRSGSASARGAEVVVGTALMRIGENSRTVAAAVRGRLGEVARSLPPGVRLEPALDRTVLVDATIRTVATNLGEGALFVIAVLFALLGNVRAALITALAIPLSMLLTAIGMVQSGTSGNLMSLGAIDFGLVVDGGVIIVENCVRRIAERQKELGRALTPAERLATVLDASRQVRSATAFGEAIIITVYIPILFLVGVEGKMFRPMAMTVIFALAAAFVLSLTFIPAAVALGIRGRVRERPNLLVRGATALYEPFLRAALRRPLEVVTLGGLTFAGAVVLFGALGQEFVPTLDEKNFAMHAMRIPSTSLTQSTAMQLEIEKTLSRFPEVALVFSKTGTGEMATDPMPPSVSDTFIMLRPREEWPAPGEGKDALAERIERALGRVPGHNYEFTQPIQMRFNELISGVRGDLAVKVYGDDFDLLLPAANGIARVLQAIPGAASVKVEQVEGLPLMEVEPDRAAIARYGLSVADIQDIVAVAIGGRDAGLVFEGDRRFPIVVRLPEEVREDLSSLESLPVPLTHRETDPTAGHGPPPDGEPGSPRAHERPPGTVPLRSVARVRLSEGPNQVSRENGRRRIVVQANVRGRDLGSFASEAQRRVAAEVRLPAGTWLDWGGQFENLVEARKRLGLVVPICFLLIFLLLYATLRSFLHSALVFTGVPLGLSGGVVALWLRGMPFSISAAVGFIALSGVAVLNGLVMVTFINQLRREVRDPREAVRIGSLIRLRPVLMTALVASLGFVPMALATGTGAEVQRPLATVVIGGLVTATFLTLFVLPALYVLTARDRPRADSPGPLTDNA